jgi:hypothetical protein
MLDSKLNQALIAYDDVYNSLYSAFRAALVVAGLCFFYLLACFAPLMAFWNCVDVKQPHTHRRLTRHGMQISRNTQFHWF